MTYVYWIHDDACSSMEETGYIGVSHDPSKRFKAHIRSGKVPQSSELSIVFEGDIDECFNKEYELRPKKGIGWNSAIGGRQGYLRGYKRSAEAIEKTSAANRHPPKPETVEKIRAKAIGRRIPYDAALSVGLNHLGIPKPGTAEKLTGRKRTDDERRAIAAGRKQGKWDKRYLSLAKNIAGWSKDPSTKVAAIAVNHLGQILATGYNGFPRGMNDDKNLYLDRTVKLTRIVHAEMNCIYAAVINGVSLEGSTLYVYGAPICSACALGIIQSGVKRVIMKYPSEFDATGNRWQASANDANRFFYEAEVKIKKYR